MDRCVGHHVMINKLVSDRKQSHYLTWTLDIGKGTKAGGRLLGKKNGCKEQEREEEEVRAMRVLYMHVRKCQNEIHYLICVLMKTQRHFNVH